MLILRVVTRSHLSGAKNACCYLAPRHFANQAQPKAEVMDFKKQTLPAPRPKKPKREPFAKNFFMGKFDYEFLTYPEPQQPERYNEFEEWLEPIKQYMKTVNPKEFETTNKIPAHVIQNLRELGVFGARIPEDYKGINLLQSEFMRLLEVVGRIPALGLFLMKQSVPAIDVLNKYGSVEQKLKYFPKIAAGELQATVALMEPNTGPVGSNMEATAVLSEDDQFWVLDGVKTFVANANTSDVFVVFAHGMQSGQLERRQEIVSSFIVERGTEGLTVVDNAPEMLGLRGFSSGKLIMKGMKVPKANIIGKVGDGPPQIVGMFTGQRHYIAGITIPLLRNFLELLVKEILPKKYFEKEFHQTCFAQRVIADLNAAIYAIESVLYLTSGSLDTYEGQDLELETSLVEQFCVQECLRTLQSSMWLVGPKACSLVSPFEQIIRDAFTLSNYETLLYDTRIFSGLLGITHFGLSSVEELKKVRNPLQYPAFIYRKLFVEDRLKLDLEDYLHESLRECSEFLNRSLYKLKTVTEQQLVRYGQEAAEQHVDLMRLSDMTSLIYASVAIIGRASRSYCIGNRDSEHEITLSMILSQNYHKRVLAIGDDVDLGQYINGDYAARDVSERGYQTKNYYAAHPLQRNY